MYFCHSKAFSEHSSRSITAGFTKKETMKVRISHVIFSLSLVFLSFMELGAQTVMRDTVRLYFEQDRTDIVSAVGGNEKALDTICRIVDLYSDTPDFHVYIKGWASPEGSSLYNRSVSEDRAAAALAFITERAGSALSASSSTLEGLGVDWDGLCRILSDGDDFPERGDVLRIIREIPLWISDGDNVTGGRKKALMDFEGGRIWGLLTERYFPQLRRAEVVLEYTQPQDDPLPSMPQIEAAPVPVPAAATNDSVLLPEEQPVTEYLPEYKPVYRLAIKTNLLADVALMPSLELEWLINPSWSLSAQGAVAWWSIRPQHRYYQIATVYPEARWWFSTREAWHGHYLGLFAGGTLYDLENGGRGYKGEGGFVGLSYGYMLPVGKRLSLEFGIGAGWMFTEYEEYLPVPYEDGTHYVYQQTSRMNYFGPLKLKLALAWRLGDWPGRNSGKGGAR